MPHVPTPETLLRIAGLPTKPGPAADAALLIIDGQREYTTGRLPLKGIDAAVEEGTRLLAFARESGMPVIHAIHHGRPGAPVFDPDKDGVKFIAPLAPLPGETVLIKSLPNAFAGTALSNLLRNLARRELVIAGFATHMCVSATARSALDHGFRATVVAAATATRDLPHPHGAGVTRAEMIQESTLAALADRFAVVIADTSVLRQASLQAA